LEAGIAQVHGTVERRGVLLPFETEPALDLGRRIEDATLEVEQRPLQRGDEMRNHLDIRGDRSSILSRARARAPNRSPAVAPRGASVRVARNGRGRPVAAPSRPKPPGLSGARAPDETGQRR